MVGGGTDSQVGRENERGRGTVLRKEGQTVGGEGRGGLF